MRLFWDGLSVSIGLLKWSTLDIGRHFNEDACRVRTGHAPQNCIAATDCLNGLEQSLKRSNRQKIESSCNG